MADLSVEQVTMILREGGRLTPDEYAQVIKTNKPYLVEIEDQVQEVQYGDIDVKLSVRAGQVEKMTFLKGKVWLRDKSR